VSWLSVGWLSAERLVAAAAIGQLAVLILAARYARNQVAEARRLREAGQQLQEAEARPYVIVDFELGDRPPFIYLVVTNLGRTMAPQRTDRGRPTTQVKPRRQGAGTG
jgi:hypothetical protein